MEDFEALFNVFAEGGVERWINGKCFGYWEINSIFAKNKLLWMQC